MNQDEINAEIRGLSNLLEQNDYQALKLAEEVSKLFKAQFPNVDMPVYEKYLDSVTKREEFRQKIDELKNTSPTEE